MSRMVELSKKGKNKGKYFAIVDDEDYDFLNGFNWAVKQNKEGGVVYAVRQKNIDGKSVKCYMHRIVMRSTDDNKIVDHIDGNGINNQKSNLRLCTQSENNKNKKAFGASKYKGVYKIKKGNKLYWTSNMGNNKQTIFLGNFPYTPEGEIMAALKYNEHAKLIHGEFAKLNVIH